VAGKGRGDRGEEKIGDDRGKVCLLLNGGLVTPLIYSGMTRFSLRRHAFLVKHSLVIFVSTQTQFAHHL